MRIDIVTLFPGMFEGPMGLSIVGRAARSGALTLGYVDPRAFADDERGTVDDRPYGGGPGMVMMAEPLYRAVRKVRRRGSKVVLLSPRGARLDQALVERLARERHLILVCGRYEGVDERFSGCVDMELSIGDYVLTGGELPAMVVVDAVARHLPGVLKKDEARLDESFRDGTLEYPQYTRPRVWRRKKVPDTLLSGDHAAIAGWRAAESLRLTKKARPDLLTQRKPAPAKSKKERTTS